MSNYDDNGIKDSKQKVKNTDEQAREYVDTLLIKYSNDLKRINNEISRINEEVKELKDDKTPYGIIMTSPIIFLCGLFIGVLVMGFMLWTEKRVNRVCR